VRAIPTILTSARGAAFLSADLRHRRSGRQFVRPYRAHHGGPEGHLQGVRLRHRNHLVRGVADRHVVQQPQLARQECAAEPDRHAHCRRSQGLTGTNAASATRFSPAYAALPAGTLWRIGENAGLNSQALYNALLADQQRNGYSRIYGADFKVSKEVGQLQGGPIGVAVGVEARRESNQLGAYTGLGDFAGLSITQYGGSRNVYAGYTEVALPVLKQLEINAALRYDYYTDAGDAVTPKVGFKWKALNNLALRGTYAEAFRAPSSQRTSTPRSRFRRPDHRRQRPLCGVDRGRDRGGDRDFNLQGRLARVPAVG
jgi:outer membrane receptor protein involved in Fe transport